MKDREDSYEFISRRQFLWMSGAASATLFLAACGGSSDSADGSADAEPTTLRVAFPDPPNEFDPALVTAFPEYNSGYAVYDGLVRVDANLVPQPALAESWEVSDDGLTWTFKLREGVTFHHGTDFTAADVVHTYERILDEATGSALRSALSIIDSVEATDDFTVQFNLNTANSDLTVIMGSPQGRIVPADRTPDQYSTAPSGTGAFKFVEHVPGDYTAFEANADYWGGAPKVDELRFVAMPEASTQVAALSAGTVDILWQIGSENIAQLEAADGVEVLNVPSGAYQTIAMDAREAPFDDTRVRQALRLCVDRPGVLQAVLQGVGELANDHPVPAFSPFLADIPLKEPNIEMAKQLLADAGYADGIDLTLTTSTVRAGMTEFAVAVQEMCKPAGINITLESASPDTYWSETWMNRPFFASNWGMRPSIDETFSLKYHTDAKWNEGKYFNPELDAAVEAGRSATTDDGRKEAYATAQQILHDDGSVLISYFKPVLQAVRSDVTGYTPHPASWLYLDQVSVG